VSDNKGRLQLAAGEPIRRENAMPSALAAKGGNIKCLKHRHTHADRQTDVDNYTSS